MTLLLNVPIEKFFEEQILLAAKSQNQNIDPNALTYISTMLSDFMQTQNLYQFNPAEKKSQQETLVNMYFDALNTSSGEEATNRFRRMGDVSMVVSGFFSDHLNRKLVDVDYYIDMGGTAYRHAAHRATNSELQSLFQRLSFEFNKHVNLLTEVAMRSFAESADVLRTYEKWLKTKNSFLESRLREFGIQPVPQDDTTFKQ